MLQFFLLYSLIFCKKEKKKACCVFMFFSTKLLFKIKLEITWYDFGPQSKTDVFKMFFMIIPLNYFHDSLNIAVILAAVVNFSMLTLFNFL